jgi:hypothetical protein
VLEVEEADVDERVLQLLDEDGAGLGRGEEVVVERRDTREVRLNSKSVRNDAIMRNDVARR